MPIRLSAPAIYFCQEWDKVNNGGKPFLERYVKHELQEYFKKFEGGLANRILGLLRGNIPVVIVE